VGLPEVSVIEDRPQPRPVLGRVFYGWWIVASAFVIHALGGGLFFHAFGAYFLYLQAEFGWSRTLISGAFSLARLEGGFLGPLQGWLISRFGSRAMCQVGLVLFALGFAWFSRIDSAAGFYAAFFLIALGSGLCGFMTMNIVLSNWFDRKRARAIAFSAMGSSSAGLTVPLIVWALNTHGWRTTALISAVLLIVVGLPVSSLIRQAPEPYGHVPDGRRTGDDETNRAPPRRSAAQGAGLTAGDALRSPSFWLLSSGHSAALMSVSALTAHLIPYLVRQVGMPIEAAAGVAASVTAASFTCQFLGGFIGDRVNKRVMTSLCMAGHTAALIILVLAPNPQVALVGAVLHGISWGMRGPLMTPIRVEYFGRRSLATLEGFAAMVTTAGLVLGPIGTGFIADQVGDYRLAFAVLSVVTGAGILCFALARRPRWPAQDAP
jgi:MFS family permease